MPLTFQGYFEAGQFVADTPVQIPDGRKTIVMVLDEKADKAKGREEYIAYWNKMRLFQNFSFWNSYLDFGGKNRAFAGFSKSLFQNRARLARSQLVSQLLSYVDINVYKKNINTLNTYKKLNYIYFPS
jgi:hypothetical protein